MFTVYGLTSRSRTSPLCLHSHNNWGSPSNSSSMPEKTWSPMDQMEILFSCKGIDSSGDSVKGNAWYWCHNIKWKWQLIKMQRGFVEVMGSIQQHTTEVRAPHLVVPRPSRKHVCLLERVRRHGPPSRFAYFLGDVFGICTFHWSRCVCCVVSTFLDLA